jgi:hypothetical protein
VGRALAPDLPIIFWYSICSAVNLWRLGLLNVGRSVPGGQENHQDQSRYHRQSPWF